MISNRCCDPEYPRSFPYQTLNHSSICNICNKNQYTAFQPVAFFCRFHHLSAEASKKFTFNIGFTESKKI